MGFLGQKPIQILESKKIRLSDILADIMYIMFINVILADCGYQILVTKI